MDQYDIMTENLQKFVKYFNGERKHLLDSCENCEHLTIEEYKNISIPTCDKTKDKDERKLTIPTPTHLYICDEFEPWNKLIPRNFRKKGV